MNGPVLIHPIGILACVVCFLLLLTIALGMLEAWRCLRSRSGLPGNAKSIFFDWAAALIAMPFIVFPLHLLAAVGGLYRPALLLFQMVFALFGLRAVIKSRIHALFRRDMRQFSFLALLCACTVCLFIYWPFVMPFPEPFNGHHHVLINMIENFWQRGDYAIMPASQISYDNDIYVWPANLSFLLSLFSFPYIPAVGTHAILMIPGFFAFLSWRLLRDVCSMYDMPACAGDLGFLLIAFSYYSAYDFTAIGFDMMSPLLCLFFVLTFTCALRQDPWQQLPFFVLLLSVSFMVRKQIFAMLLFSMIIGSIFLIVRTWKAQLRTVRQFSRHAGLAIIFALPALFWALAVFIQYGSPFFPHDIPATARVFTPAYHALPMEPLPPPGVVTTQDDNANAILRFVRTIRSAETFAGESFFIEHFVPVNARGSIAVLIRNTLVGISNSLVLTGGLIGFCIVLFLPGSPLRAMAPLFVTCLGGFVSAGMLLFMTYHKYPHYLGYVAAPFSIAFYHFAFKRLGGRWMMNMLGAVIFGAGTFSWAYSSWGHSGHDNRLENIRFLNPYYGDAYMRLGRMANRNPAEISQEIAEYEEAERKGKILFMDHEPGALIPSVLGIIDITTALFFDNPQASPIQAATSEQDLRSALERFQIRSICVPGRAHGSDGALLMRLLREHEGPHRYVVPVEELLDGGQ